MLAGEERWFTKDAAFDGQLSVRFGEALKLARLGVFDHWAETPQGALGLVILLDQVSRNIHRGSPLAFAGDAKALSLAKMAVSRGYHQKLVAPLAMWLLMPFEHCGRPRRAAPLRRSVRKHWAQRYGLLGSTSSRHHRPLRQVSAPQCGAREKIDRGRNRLPAGGRLFRIGILYFGMGIILPPGTAKPFGTAGRAAMARYQRLTWG